MSVSTAAPVADLPGWRHTFVDDFPVDIPLGAFPATSKWTAYPSPWKDSSRHGTYSPKTVISVAGGILTEHIHTAAGVHQVAAILPALKWQQTYGRYAVRFRFDELPGYKIAFMLWPNSGNSKVEGEVDFPEMNLGLGTDVWAFDHHTNAVDPNDQSSFHTALLPGAWHTAVIEWSPALLVFILDGIELGRTDIRVPHTNMHWVLQTETAIGGTAPDDTVEGDVQIDWVSAWAYDPSILPTAPRTIVLDAPVTATGTITLTTAASPDVTAVKWVCDNEEIGYSAHPPFQTRWYSTRCANGAHTIYTKGHDTRGWWDGPKRTIIVNN